MMNAELARLVQEERHRELAEIRHRAWMAPSLTGPRWRVLSYVRGRLFEKRPVDLDRAKTPVVIRLAEPADAPAIAHLAALEDTASPSGPTIVAVVNERIEAALPLAGGASVSNPFSASGEFASLLRLRAEQLAEAS